MFKAASQPNNVVARWLPVFAVGAFAGYWIYTLCMIFIPKTTTTAAPAASKVYQAFFYQNWKLFATTNDYNREIKLLLFGTNTSGQPDTILLVDYLLSQKRSLTPFNTREELIDRMIFLDANRLERAVYEQYVQAHPGDKSGGYVLESGTIEAFTATSKMAQQSLQNIERFARYIAGRLNLDGPYKQFQLQVVHVPTPPRDANPLVHLPEVVIFKTALIKW